MSSVLIQPITAADFWQLPDNGTQRDFVRGEVIETKSPGGQHGAISVILATMLRLWTKQRGGGYIGVETGYILARDPDTVRGPNVSYVRPERIPSEGIPEGFWDLAPDLAVEIISPNETADEVREKVRDVLHAGTPLVWTIYPRLREVIVHTADGLAQAYTADATLASPDVLPGLACTVAELFE